MEADEKRRETTQFPWGETVSASIEQIGRRGGDSGIERLGLTAGKLAEYLEEERVDDGLDEVMCTMVYVAPIEAVGVHKVGIQISPIAR